MFKTYIFSELNPTYSMFSRSSIFFLALGQNIDTYYNKSKIGRRGKLPQSVECREKSLFIKAANLSSFQVITAKLSAKLINIKIKIINYQKLFLQNHYWVST